MARYDIGFGGIWREHFDDLGAATHRAKELARTGEVVEIARRRFGLHRFVTAFPEFARSALKARRGHPYIGDLWGFGVSDTGRHRGHGGPPGGHAAFFFGSDGEGD
jgi:hypothetical protein